MNQEQKDILQVEIDKLEMISVPSTDDEFNVAFQLVETIVPDKAKRLRKKTFTDLYDIAQDTLESKRNILKAIS